MDICSIIAQLIGGPTRAKAISKPIMFHSILSGGGDKGICIRTWNWMISTSVEG